MLGVLCLFVVWMTLLAACLDWFVGVVVVLFGLWLFCGFGYFLLVCFCLVGV